MRINNRDYNDACDNKNVIFISVINININILIVITMMMNFD